MRVRKTLIVVALPCALFACSGTQPEAKPVPVAQAPAPPPPPAAPAPPPPPVSADDVPPRQTVSGDGITITEKADGRVRLQTTAVWDEPIDTTYDDCDYYRRALPVLKRQIEKSRAKLLDGACVQPKGKPKLNTASRVAKPVPAKPVQNAN